MKKRLFNGAMVNDVDGPIAGSAAHHAWSKVIGEKCFYRGGMRKESFTLDPRWIKFSVFRSWWKTQDHQPGTTVSPLLAPGDEWRVIGPDTCEIMPTALVRLLKHFYFCLTPVVLEDNGTFSFLVPTSVMKVERVQTEATTQQNAMLERGIWVGNRLRKFCDGGGLDMKIENKAVDVEAAPLWRCRTC